MDSLLLVKDKWLRFWDWFKKKKKMAIFFASTLVILQETLCLKFFIIYLFLLVGMIENSLPTLSLVEKIIVIMCLVCPYMK